jgi:hypothetical protein
MNIKLVPSNILTAFDDVTIGTKVINPPGFFEAAEKAVAAFDFAAQQVRGQGFILCPEAVPYLSAGVGRRSSLPGDYVCRGHRGRVDLFLKREFAAPCERAALIVYTREAYLADPEVAKDKAEVEHIKTSRATHVLVAVLGFAGPKAPLSPYRLVANLAGGNREAATWTTEEIAAQAKASIEYDAEWCVVAD